MSLLHIERVLDQKLTLNHAFIYCIFNNSCYEKCRLLLSNAINPAMGLIFARSILLSKLIGRFRFLTYTALFHQGSLAMISKRHLKQSGGHIHKNSPVGAGQIQTKPTSFQTQYHCMNVLVGIEFFDRSSSLLRCHTSLRIVSKIDYQARSSRTYSDIDKLELLFLKQRANNNGEMVPLGEYDDFILGMLSFPTTDFVHDLCHFGCLNNLKATTIKAS